MKTTRPWPCYTVTPKAEAALVGGHPWVYEDEITAAPDTAPETSMNANKSKTNRMTPSPLS